MQDESIISSTDYKFVKISEDNCIDQDFFNHVYMSQYFRIGGDFFSSKTFIQGRGISGRIDDNVDIVMQDGLYVNPVDFLQLYNDKNHVRYSYEDDTSKVTGFISAKIENIFDPSTAYSTLLNPKIFKSLEKMKSGYYVKGVHVPKNSVNEIVEPTTWTIKTNNDSSDEITIKQTNTYAFADIDSDGKIKLFKNGDLYTGQYDQKNYKYGELVTDQ